MVASDPGLARLRMSTNAAITMASSLGVEYFLARMLHTQGLGLIVAMLLGAVIAMMGTMALTGLVNWQKKAKRALFFPVAVGGGLATGVLTASNTDLTLAVFVVVMFVAVAIRRFGMPYFFYGFMGWMGYFFASFTHATLAELPFIGLAVTVAATWVLLLSTTVLRIRPRRTLTRALQAFELRSRLAAQALAAYLQSDDDKTRTTRRIRLRTRSSQLSVAALMVEAWIVEPGALPPEWSGFAVRQRLLGIQHAIDRMAWAGTVMAESHLADAGMAADIADALAKQDDPGAMRLVPALKTGSGDVQRAAREFAKAAVEFIALSTEVRRAGEAQVALGPDTFEPAVGLMMEDLPGSPAIAPTVQARGHQWNPLARLDFPIRQAIQVAIAGGLAILAGRALSPERYYWAVIAAFIMSAGTATRVDALIKGVNRVLGTMGGLVAAVATAQVTAGHIHWALAVVVISMFLGIYLFRVSYAYMIFFLTIMLGQLYSILHEFSAGLLVLRLEETAIGTACGLVVSLLVVPLSARDTVAAVRRGYLDDLHAFLLQVAKAPTGDQSGVLEQQVRQLENRQRQLVQVADPLTPPLAWGFNRPQVRHRLAMYAALTGYLRTLAVSLHDASPDDFPPAWNDVCRQLADTVQEVADPDANLIRDLTAPLADAVENQESPFVRSLVQVVRFLEDFALSEPL